MTQQFKANLRLRQLESTLPSAIVAQKVCHLVFADFSLRNVSDDSLEHRLSSDKCRPVKLEEGKGGHGTRALVAIDKGMVSHYMEKVGCGHLEQIGMKVLVAKAGLGHSHC